MLAHWQARVSEPMRIMEAFNFYLAVKCSECGSEHSSEEVETVNIEEDIFGRDLLTFICPVTKKQAQSNIYRKNYVH